MASGAGSIQLRGASVIAAGRRILDDIDLCIESGEMVVIVGASGAGKSTLLRSLLGLVEQTRDQVWLGQQQLSCLDHRQRAAHMAWLPQDLSINEPVAVAKLVAAARFRINESHLSCQDAVRSVLSVCGVGHLAQQSVTTLSGGERQRVALAAMLAQDAAMLMLDEPANHLDPGLMAQMMTMLVAQWQTGRGVVMVSHQINLVLQGVPRANHEQVRIVGLKDGRLSYQGLLSDPSLADALGDLYQLPMRLIEVEGQRLLLTEAIDSSTGSPS
jgi:iron complex transport system ATP-binding protein